MLSKSRLLPSASLRLGNIGGGEIQFEALIEQVAVTTELASRRPTEEMEAIVFSSPSSSSSPFNSSRFLRTRYRDSYLVASDISQLRLTLSELKKKKFVPRPRDYTHLILDSISIGLIKTKEDAFRIASHCQNRLSRSVDEILEALRQSQLIGIEDNEEITVAITQLGSAISSSFLTPSEGQFIYKQLVKANASVDLRTDLQLLYLITPLPNRIGFKGLKLTNLFKYYEKLLTPTERDSAKKMGITNASCLKLSFGHREDEVHGRFYLTLVLRELMANKPEAEILREFGLDEMQLDLLKTQTVVYLKTVISITDQLGWHYLNILMKSFGQKVEMTISTDVIDLMHLSGIDGVRALAFVEQGIESVRQLAMTDPPILEKILRHTIPFKEGEKKGDKNEWLQGQITDCKTAVQTLVANAEQFLKNRDSDKTFEFTINESERSMETEGTICSLILNKRSCLERLCSNAKFLVLDYVEDHLQILNDDEYFMEMDFDTPECSKCSENVADELEKLFSSTVPIFAKDLSLLFYQCKHHFLSVSFIQENWTSFLSKFHCVLSILRVRNKSLDPDPEGLGSYFANIASRFCNKTLAEPCIYPLCRLIKNVILSQKISDHMMKLTSIWNESVQTSIYMSYYGIALNLEQVYHLRQSLQVMMTKTEEKIWKFTDQKFNVYKVSSTRKVLSECNVFMDQNSRAPGSVDELSRTNHPIAELIVSARNAYTAYTQLEDISSHCDPDGRVRCFYNTLSHATGRIGIENPPIQMLIKRKIIDGQSARSVFTAKDGCVLISADFSQLELRMILAMSGDETLARLINDEIDPFEYLSASLREEGIHINRDTAKKLFYSIVYGIGASALSLDLNIDIRRAEQLISVFSTVFKGVDHWLRRVTQTALERRYASNIWGLGVGLASMRSTEAKRRIPNYIIQSSVTHAFRVALNNIRTSFPKSMGGMVLQIHDEIICEVKRDLIHESVELIKKLMSTSLLGIDFPVSIKIGPNWGQMEKIESSCDQKTV
ncbi:unnamed protein product [Bursaphelenchus xylophilus]|uniref:(pine wood nematode) hypothetical protein n=1 Tax=Bursaphelenchus xylophilus TaxID=6326 RepID=A0A1I7ST49_BURXY|nr:unnamed protein product [Bursaphelenchus xylophilus]CAG9108733.1 unnamed protein product [Bursaphelenchus xylophilus]